MLSSVHDKVIRRGGIMTSLSGNSQGEPWDAFGELRNVMLARKRGGIVDCHGHPFTEGTLTREQYQRLGNMSLEDKWEEADRLRNNAATLVSFPKRLEEAVVNRIKQGIRGARFYIDISPAIGLEAIHIAIGAKRLFARQGFYLQIAAYPMQGIDRDTESDLLRQACALPEVEAIGCTPSRGRSGIDDLETSKERINYYSSLALECSKILDAHLDQKNHPSEQETYLFVSCMGVLRSLGYDKPIGATHCISMAAWEDRDFLHYVLREMARTHVSLIVCPGSNINNEQLSGVASLTHNSIAPWNTALELGVNVAIGIDNIKDLYMPSCDGDIWHEAKTVINSVRWQGEMDIIAEIFTTHGWKALGLK